MSNKERPIDLFPPSPAVTLMALMLALAPAVEAQAQKTANQVSPEYRAAFEKAKSVDEILLFQDKATRD